MTTILVFTSLTSIAVVVLILVYVILGNLTKFRGTPYYSIFSVMSIITVISLVLAVFLVVITVDLDRLILDTTVALVIMTINAILIQLILRVVFIRRLNSENTIRKG